MMPIAKRRPSTGVTSAASSAHGRVHLLDVPFSLRGIPETFGASWNGALKSFAWLGETLPHGLEAFKSQNYSYERFREDVLNGVTRPAAAPTKRIELRPHQQTCAETVRRVVAEGRSGFLVADDVGLGKTMETWASILEMEESDRVLVVCPLAVVAAWRQTIGWMGDGGRTIVVMNYERLGKLFEAPPASKAPSKRRKRRRSLKATAKSGSAEAFDVIVWDECHRLRNPASARSIFARKLGAEADFEFFLSATAGQDPSELIHLYPLIAESTGDDPRLLPYVEWCAAAGIGVSKGAYGKLVWRGASDDPEVRAGAVGDLERVRDILFGGRLPLGIRRTPTDIAGWPEINRILLPVHLDPEDRRLYEAAWTAFRRELDLVQTGARDSKNALVARLRFRQKSSLLRTAATADLAATLLEQGLQVAVSVAFRETLAVLRDALASHGPVAEIHGDMDGPEKERQRLRFQSGECRTVVYTVTEAISLHQGELNDVPRANLVHDLRWSGIGAKQVEGRTHRNGKFSQVYWLLAEDTVEERIARVVAGRMLSMGAMQGDDTTVSEIERMLASIPAG